MSNQKIVVLVELLHTKTFTVEGEDLTEEQAKALVIQALNDGSTADGVTFDGARDFFDINAVHSGMRN